MATPSRSELSLISALQKKGFLQMFCSYCGIMVHTTGSICPKCTGPLSETFRATSSSQNTMSNVVQGGKEPRAAWSMWLGILSIFCFSVLTGIPAIITGHISRARIRRSGGRLRGAGQALAGLIMGYVSVAMTTLGVLMFFGAIVAAMGLRSAIPGATAASNPVSDVRTLNTAITAYKERFNVYPPSLKELGPNYSKEDPAQAANLVDFALSIGLKGDYIFQYQQVDTQGYTLKADPLLAPQSTTKKHYYTDQTGVIRVEGSKEAGPDSDALQNSE